MNSIVRTSAVSLFVAAVATALAACGQQPQAPSTDASAPAVAPPTAAVRSYPSDMFEQPAVAQLRTAGNCSIDRINKEPVGSTSHAIGDELLIGGWFAPPQGVQAQRPLVVLDNGDRQFAHVFVTGGKREDVARQLQRPELGTSGFNVRVTLKGLPEGEYALWLAQEGAGGFRCSTRKSITVTP